MNALDALKANKLVMFSARCTLVDCQEIIDCYHIYKIRAHRCAQRFKEKFLCVKLVIVIPSRRRRSTSRNSMSLSLWRSMWSRNYRELRMQIRW